MVSFNPFRARPPAPPLHVSVLSWHGMHARAHAIAAAIAPALGPRDGLHVIYSNHGDTDETGPGQWEQVPQSWYFGAKFAHSLARAGDAPAMLQIQADAHHGDWPALVARLRAALRDQPRAGLWAPDLDWTPYPSDLAAEARVGAGPLWHVTQTDGVVWALTAPVMAALGRLDYTMNPLGWGIDYTAATLARTDGLSVLRDTGIHVDHPRTRGYSDDGAERGMAEFLEQLPPATRRAVRTRQAFMTYRRERGLHAAGRWDGPAPRRLDTDGIGRVALLRGRLLVSGPRGLHRRVRIRCGDVTFGLAPCAPPSPRALPQPLAFAAARAPDHEIAVNGLGPWQMPGVETARMVVLTHGPVTAALGPPVRLAADTGELELGVALAAHRATGTLRLSLWPEGKPREARDIPLTIWGGHPGGATPGGWQRDTLCIPGHDRPRLARLFIDYPGTDGTHDTDDAPPIFFVAAPHVTARVAQPDLVTPVEVRGTAPAARWYAAAIPPDLRGPLVLEGGDASDLFPPPPPLAVTQGDGTLHARAAAAATVTLWRDGVALARAALGPDGCDIPLPPCPGRLELRDITGSLVLWAGDVP